MGHQRAETASASVDFWIRHVRLGLAMSWTVIAMMAVYLVLTPDHPNARLLWCSVAMAALISTAAWRLPWSRLVASGHVLLAMQVWSMSLVPLVVLLTFLDGGPGSAMTQIIVLPLVFSAMTYPVRATVTVGATAVVGQLVIATMDEQFHLGHVVLQVTVLTLITVMGAQIARNHARSLAHSEELATRLGELAYLDGLTGCLNHRGFRERLDTEVAAALRHHRSIALLQVDLDHFKRVNDNFGHPAGDRVLAEVGEALRALLRRNDLVGRMGGEEFVVLLPDTDLARAQAIGERVRTAIGQLDGPVHVTASVGVSALPEVVTTEEALVESADQALYVAKRDGRDRVVVAGDRPGQPQPHAALATSSVTTLLDSGGRSLASVFQPIVGVADGIVHGYEALSRVDGSNVPPDRWLAAAQQEGRRCELELAMLDAALSAHARAPWAAGLPLFLNVGPDLLATSQLWDRLDRLPAGTVFELSERLVLSDSSALVTAARRWVEAGVQLAIDDLGAGYANLRAVLELEPAFVKLDRFLVQELDQRPNHRALVASLVTFAAQMGTTIIAEGVERDQELWVLAELGVPLAQGFGLARPAASPQPVTWAAPAAPVTGAAPGNRRGDDVPVTVGSGPL